LGLALVAEVLAVSAWAAIVDFKGDLGGIPTLCEMYGGNVTRVSTTGQASGSLCPFRFIVDPMVAASHAVDNLTAMLPRGQVALVETQIRTAANQVAQRVNPGERSTAAIIGVLQESEDPGLRAVGAELAELASDPLARPVAGPPDLLAKQIPTGPGLVYMRLDDLRWPGSATPQQDWKPGHRLTAMLLQAVFTYMVYMSTQVKGIPKILALTELHLITKYDFGKDLVGSTARMGRALDTNLLLDTQACVELLSIDGLAEQISATYAFRVDTSDEAAAQARFLQLEPEDTVVGRQKQWKQGQCLTRDPQGQIGAIWFDLLTDEIKETLRTTPDRNKPGVVGVGELPLNPGDSNVITALEMEYLA
jgi:hypothetical protein